MDKILDSEFPYADGILNGKNALVCGASKGIGRATSLMLARAGAKVVVCARSSDKLDDLLEEMYGIGHSKLILDLEETSTLESKINKLIENQNIHILVNNAGGPPCGPLFSN